MFALQQLCVLASASEGLFVRRKPIYFSIIPREGVIKGVDASEVCLLVFMGHISLGGQCFMGKALEQQ